MYRAIHKDSRTVKLDGNISRVQVIRQCECCFYTFRAEMLAHITSRRRSRPMFSVGT